MVTAEKLSPPSGQYLAEYLQQSPEFMSRVAQGVEEYKAGKVHPWSELRKKIRGG